MINRGDLLRSKGKLMGSLMSWEVKGLCQTPCRYRALVNSQTHKLMNSQAHELVAS